VYYTPTDGSIVVSESTISVVSVIVTTIITIDGSAATVFPPTSPVVPVYNLTAFGFSGSLAGDNGESSASSSSTTSTSTTATTTPAPSNYIFVELAEWAEIVDKDEEEQVQYWVVFSLTITHSTSTIDVFAANTLADNTATVTGGSSMGYPPVTLTFNAFGIDNCVYSGASTTAVGSLACPGVNDITCERDPQFGEDLSREIFEPGAVVYPDVRCYW
jgi:hypothetical protein